MVGRALVDGWPWAAHCKRVCVRMARFAGCQLLLIRREAMIKLGICNELFEDGTSVACAGRHELGYDGLDRAVYPGPVDHGREHRAVAS